MLFTTYLIVYTNKLTVVLNYFLRICKIFCLGVIKQKKKIIILTFSLVFKKEQVENPLNVMSTDKI